MNTTDIFTEMVNRWPSHIVARREVGNFTGGLIKPKFLANQDSLGTGPAEKIEVCGRVAYSAQSLADWLRSRSKQSA